MGDGFYTSTLSMGDGFYAILDYSQAMRKRSLMGLLAACYMLLALPSAHLRLHIDNVAAAVRDVCHFDELEVGQWWVQYLSLARVHREPAHVGPAAQEAVRNDAEDEGLGGFGIVGDNLLRSGGGHAAELGAALELEIIAYLEVLRMAGCRITPVLVFWTKRELNWVKFTFETGFELPSSCVDLP
jgi:hypothetical protein